MADLTERVQPRIREVDELDRVAALAVPTRVGLVLEPTDHLVSSVDLLLQVGDRLARSLESL